MSRIAGLAIYLRCPHPLLLLSPSFGKLSPPPTTSETHAGPICLQTMILPQGLDSKAPSVNSLAEFLVRSDAKEVFVQNLDSIYDHWVNFMVETTLPPNVSAADPRVGVALRALDEYIANEDCAISRLGSVQLARLLISLRGKVQIDRKSGRWLPKQRSSSVVIDIYLQAKGRMSDKMSRRRTLQSVRMSRRWNDLAGQCPLLITTLSEKAERIMSVACAIIVSKLLTHLVAEI